MFEPFGDFDWSIPIIKSGQKNFLHLKAKKISLDVEEKR